MIAEMESNQGLSFFTISDIEKEITEKSELKEFRSDFSVIYAFQDTRMRKRLQPCRRKRQL